jgi:hypothetical protein
VDLDVDMAILIHPERIVVMIRLKQDVQRLANQTQLGVKVYPLLGFEHGHVLTVLSEDNDEATEKILIHVEGRPPP